MRIERQTRQMLQLKKRLARQAPGPKKASATRKQIAAMERANLKKHKHRYNKPNR